MSEQKHTPGPWHVGRKVGNMIYARDGLDVIAECDSSIDDVPRSVGEANARRIVACVNACEGISTADLESGAVKAREILAAHYKKQRDELIKERDSLSESLRLVAEQADKWRVETHVFMQQRDELMAALDNVTAAMENVLLHNGAAMTPADREGRTKLVRAARAAIAKINQ